MKRTTEEPAPQQPVAVERPAKPPPPRRIPARGVNAPATATKTAARSLGPPQQRRPCAADDGLTKVSPARVAVPRPQREAPALNEPCSTQSQDDLPMPAIAPMPILAVSSTVSTEGQTTPSITGSPLRTSSATESPDANASVSLGTAPAPLADVCDVEHESTIPGLTLPRQPISMLSSEALLHRDAVQRVVKKHIPRRIVLGSSAALLVIAFGLGLPMFTRKTTLVSAQRPVQTATIHPAATRDSVPEAMTAATQMRLTAVASTTATAPENAAVAPPIVNGNTSAADLPPLQSRNALAGEDSIPDYVSKPALLHLGSIAIRQAQRCHPHGHAVGSARVLVTFASNGRVSDARIEGEPLASAPVASCILGHAHAIRIAKFNGAPFTYTLPITMR